MRRVWGMRMQTGADVRTGTGQGAWGMGQGGWGSWRGLGYTRRSSGTRRMGRYGLQVPQDPTRTLGCVSLVTETLSYQSEGYGLSSQ